MPAKQRKNITNISEKNQMTNLNNQIALVTGASRGIGAAIAAELGRQGATVIGTATSAAGAEAITASLKAAQINGVGMALDVNNSSSPNLMHSEERYRCVAAGSDQSFQEAEARPSAPE